MRRHHNFFGFLWHLWLQIILLPLSQCHTIAPSFSPSLTSRIEQVLYSSGDDVTMCAWDLRQLSRPSARLSSAHTVGISALASCPHSPHLLASGSYDETIRLWDVRVLARPMAVCQVAAGDGVWRIKWHRQRADVLLAACMHGGAAVVQLSEGGEEEEEGGMRGSVVERYEGHQSMVYGADWWAGRERGNEREGDSGEEGRGEDEEQNAVEDGEEWIDGEHEVEEEEDEEEESVEEAEEHAENEDGDAEEEEECGSPSNLHVRRPFGSVYGQLTSEGEGEESESDCEGEGAEASAVSSWVDAVQRQRTEERCSEERRPVVVTCSFYDQSLHVWAPGAV